MRADGVKSDAPRALSAREKARARGLRLIHGGGEGRDATLRDRNDVARLLAASAADLLLHRISTARASEIEERVNRALRLFDRARTEPLARPILRRELDQLEAIWREGREARR
ncbi:MAG: hypothetical protein IJC63_01390 [Myxococcaceae bacterium]|nr:hypothetical protein [Myxococcaceae bacterium]MBR2980249.1 hypothetical protein [Myxococcaceae bacterium]